ncbi:MAG: oligosaccharide flippase family protein, partial [Bacillota bacterium]
MKHKRLSILSGTLLLTAGGLFAQLLGFFYRVGLSQLIGAETLGLYQLIMPVYSLLYAVTVMGLTISVSTLSARAYALGDQEGVRRVLRRCVTAFLLLIIPLGIAGIASSEIISTQFLGDIRTRLGVILLVPCILLTGLEDLNKYCFYGIGRIGVPAICEALEQIIRIAAVFGLLIWIVPQSPENALGVIVGGMMICELFSVVFLWVALRKQFRKARPRSGEAEIAWRQIFTIAIPISASSIITTLMSSVNYILIPQKLIESGMGISAAMASFGVLCGMTIPMLMLPTGFVNALGLTVVPDLAQK